MGRKFLPGSETGRGTIPSVWDGWGGPPKGLGRVGGPSGRSATGRGKLREIRDRSGDQARRSETGRESLPEVQDGLWDHLVGPRRFGRSSRKSGTGLEVLPEVRDGSGDPPEGSG